MDLLVMSHHHGCCSKTGSSSSLVVIVTTALIILLSVDSGFLRWESSFKRYLGWLGWLVELTMTQGNCCGMLSHPVCTEGPVRCRMMIRLDAGLGSIVAC